jgi:hypothetical protein
MDVLRENFLMARALGQLLQRGGFALKEIPSAVTAVIQRKAWQDFTTESGRRVHHDTFDSFVVTPPLEGLVATVRQLEHLCRDDAEALRAIREVKKRKRGPNNASNGSETKRLAGNTLPYTLDRLSREAPELYEEVKQGRISANAAAIKAGFRKRTWTAPVDLRELFKALERRYPGVFKMIGDE